MEVLIVYGLLVDDEFLVMKAFPVKCAPNNVTY